MRYWSDSLQSLFDSEEALVAAENKKKVEDEERHNAEIREVMEKKKLKVEVDKARDAAEEANQYYQKLLIEYCKKYGAYEYTGETKDFPFSASNILKNLARDLKIF